MPENHALYLMLSRTATGMGKTIRLFTRYEYNHVSLTLDPTFQNWVSFARYVQHVPLAGGFVLETAQRFSSIEGPMPVKICRIALSENRYQQLVHLFSKAGDQDSGLIYNTFGALTTVIGCRFSLPGAYTCLDFASTVLGQQFKSIRDLDEALQDQLVFQGNLKDLLHDEQNDDTYFIERGFWGGVWDTAVHFTRLINRLIHRSSHEDPLLAELQKEIDPVGTK
ncbi:MAG: hypothetical protein IJX67_08490 [Oscillospiraceae bacterium]|nr:hypothetical protein [Oscillospiraceae bacterium]